MLRNSSDTTGWFREAGLHEWMPFVIFRTRSHERSQRHFQADFWVDIASCCVQQWKLNLELQSGTNATSCSCKNDRGKGMEGGKKMSLHRFLADQKIMSSWKKCVLGHPVAWATSYCLLPDTFWLQASKNAYKLGSVKFANSLSPLSIVKEVRTRGKSRQGT